MNVNSLEEIDQLTDDDIARRLTHTRELLGKAGAHYVIDGFAELLDVVDDINSHLKRGERP